MISEHLRIKYPETGCHAVKVNQSKFQVCKQEYKITYGEIMLKALVPVCLAKLSIV